MQCARHGAQRRAFVCTHILQSFEDGSLPGFIWGRDEEGEYDAVCSACNAMPAPDFDRRAKELVRAICLQCFADAGSRHGVVWKSARP